MKAILIFLAIPFFLEVSINAQLRLPDVVTKRPGSINSKPRFDSHTENQLKETIQKQWYTVASPTSEAVLQTSIACDESEMVIFYREPDYSINIDGGVIKKWNGSYWENFSRPTNQCHSPDIDIEGSVVVATWYTDSYDYGYGSNINGPWVSFSGTFLQNQYYPRAAMAMGFPYMSFTCKYSDGMPGTYDMLHIRSIIGVGRKIELRGGWRKTYTSVGMKTDITGDDNAWYCAYTQKGFLYVDKGAVIDGHSEYTDLGDGFRMSNPVSNPEIIVYEGYPVVAWIENGSTEIYIAEWSGSEWLLLGSGTITEGLLNTVRMAKSSSNLYVVYTISDAEANLSVNRYDGSNWYELPLVQNQLESNISTADIAIYNGDPVIAFTENNQLTVKMYSDKAVSDKTAEFSVNPIIRVYPNPLKNDFTIDLGQMYAEVSFKVMTVTGQVIIHQEYGMADLIQGTLEATSGLFLFEICTEGERIAFLKIIKE